MGKTGGKKIGLALGSGAARGLAHIGVIKALEEAEIGIDMIAGTSVGAFIGALYASGVPVARMEQVAKEVDWRQMAGWVDPIIPTTGLIDGKKLARFMSELLPASSFEQLKIPLAMVTTDIESGETLIIKRGNLLEALRAAVAFPGIFTPVRFGNRFLVDGGLCHPVPADVTRDLGADLVIGVCAIPPVAKQREETFLPSEPSSKSSGKGLLDLFNAERIEKLVRDIWKPNDKEAEVKEKHAKNAGRKPPGIFKICAQSVAIMENEINALRLARNEIDILIRPDLNGITLLEFHRAEESIQAGERAARGMVAKIRALIAGDCNA